MMEWGMNGVWRWRFKRSTGWLLLWRACRLTYFAIFLCVCNDWSRNQIFQITIKLCIYVYMCVCMYDLQYVQKWLVFVGYFCHYLKTDILKSSFTPYSGFFRVLMIWYITKRNFINITHWIPPVKNADGALRTGAERRFWLMLNHLLFLKMGQWYFRNHWLSSDWQLWVFGSFGGKLFHSETTLLLNEICKH